MRTHRRAALIALVLAVLLGAAPGAPAANVGGARADVQRLEAELARLDAAAGEAAVAHNRAMDRLDAVRARIRLTTAELARNRTTHRIAQRRLADRLSALYRTRVPGLVEVLLISGSLSDAASARDLLGRIARADAGLVRTVRERRARLAVLAARLRDQRSAARREVRAAASRRAGLVALVDRRRTVLAGARAELRRALARRRAELARLAAAKRAAEAGRAAAPVARGTQPPPSPVPAGTTHVFPVRGPTTYTDDWLAPRGSRYHEGIDLMAARGTPVVAVAAGTVFRVGASAISGNRLWLRDGSGTEFFYAHLDGFAPAAGEGASVAAGTVIGYVGNTGDASGGAPHLHFEIHPGGGGPVRPYPIVSSWPRA